MDTSINKDPEAKTTGRLSVLCETYFGETVEWNIYRVCIVVIPVTCVKSSVLLLLKCKNIFLEKYKRCERKSY